MAEPTGTEDEARDERIRALAEVLHHPDRAQLAFQLLEIAGDGAYQRHGVVVGPGDVVLDVGANVGVAAAFFSRQCGAGTVHSFEPIGPTFELLRANVADLPGCVAHHYGLSSEAAEVTMTYYPDAAAISGAYADVEHDRGQLATAMANLGADPAEADRLTASHQSLSCELRTLSSVLARESIERVDLLKIDVEGAELDVLAGIDESDWPRIRQVAMEIHSQAAGAAIEAELRDRGFRVATDQDPAFRSTPVHNLFAVRPPARPAPDTPG